MVHRTNLTYGIRCDDGTVQSLQTQRTLVSYTQTHRTLKKGKVHQHGSPACDFKDE